jgi:hypothetical protein
MPQVFNYVIMTQSIFLLQPFMVQKAFLSNLVSLYILSVSAHFINFCTSSSSLWYWGHIYFPAALVMTFIFQIPDRNNVTLFFLDHISTVCTQFPVHSDARYFSYIFLDFLEISCALFILFQTALLNPSPLWQTIYKPTQFCTLHLLGLLLNLPTLKTWFLQSVKPSDIREKPDVSFWT